MSAAENLQNGTDVNFMAVSRTAMPDARIIYNFNNRERRVVAWRQCVSPRPTLLIPPYVTTICLSNGVNEWKNFQRNSAATSSFPTARFNLSKVMKKILNHHCSYFVKISNTNIIKCIASIELVFKNRVMLSTFSLTENLLRIDQWEGEGEEIICR